MAIERKAYSCEHKCRKVVLSKARMEKHEAVCLSNPARRSCKTCAYDIPAESATPYDFESGYSPVGPFCELDLRGDKRCVVMCPEWKGGL